MKIQNLLQNVAIAGAVFITMPAVSTAAAAENAAPLGLEIGKARSSDVARLAPRHQKVGINQYSSGPQWTTDGSEAGVEGVKGAVYLFDRSNVLVAVELHFPKNPVKMMQLLGGKYKLVSNKVDKFMNYGTARFEKGNSFIAINAPHLSFDMTVTYATKDLMGKYVQKVIETGTEKTKQLKQAL